MKNKKAHQENWEKKARKLLAELTTILIETGSADGFDIKRIIAKRDEVMNFIRQLLSQQRKEMVGEINREEECDHNWVWCPIETSTLRGSGYWRCSKCGLFKL